MIVYWLLLLPLAIISYSFGSMSTISIASRMIFHRDLRRLGAGSVWLSSFRRHYGFAGALGLLLVEALRDAIPILLGSLLLGLKGHADVGKAFAGFCLVLGRLFPLIDDFKGSNAITCMIAAAMFVDITIGIAALAAFLVMLVIMRSVAAGTIFSAIIMLSAAVLVIDDPLMVKLCIFTAGIVLFRHIPAFFRILNRTDPKISFREDLSYKFDE